uniref:shikimate dehydrogenase (NADP(+)) n=1 Tax=uncultured Helicobacter sp. TaxID=175537 RepID=A0A650EKT0_9HELI|nr:shikimate dehydrogenase (NADP(+)) [uncultured Helicobacter sp.]
MLRFFGVFGSPIAHSKSPLLHNDAFHILQNQIHFSGYYSRILLENPSRLREVFCDLGLSGANITIPLKEEAYRQCDEVRGIATHIGACNTWVLDRENRIIGYNTDAQGFYECIKPYRVKTALIIGAGGSAKAVAMILAHHQIATTILNRSSDKLVFFEQKGFETYLSSEFKPIQSYDIVINTTSAGLNHHELPLAESKLRDVFTNAKYAFDLIYGKETPFLTLAKSFDLSCSDGKDMLIYQAALAFEKFCFLDEKVLDTQQIIALMREVL